MFIDEFYINFLLGFLSALLLSGMVFWYFYIKKSSEFERVYRYFQKQKDYIRSLEYQLDNYREKLNDLKDTKDSLTKEFKDIAKSILLDSTKESSSHFKMAIEPIYKNIENFSKQIKEFYIDESKERYSLKKEIERLNYLNQKISQDAINLTNALKGDNKIQGDWGEIVLSRVLEISGLKKDREYVVQNSFKDENLKNYRPDVIIKLPNKREVIIDSKVSLKSYELYFNNRSNKEQYLNDFIKSIKNHIHDLNKKEYQKLEEINSLDFVLMFIPIEGAFSTLINSEKNIYEYAYRKNIILVSPTTLLSVLRVIEHSWRETYQNKNAKLIAKKASLLHEKFKLFVDEMKNVEKSLKKAQESYDLAFKRLSEGKGNLIDRANELKLLQSQDSSFAGE